VRNTLRSLFVAFCITFVIGGMFHFNVFYDIEMPYYDRASEETRPVDTRIVIVGVDENSLESIGQWPWPRDIHAQLIDRLIQAGVKGIGLDFLFAEPAKDPAEDEALQKALQNRPHVVVASAFVFPERQSTENALTYEKHVTPIYSLAEEQQSHINILADRGEVVRRILLGIPTKEGKMIPSFNVRLANLFLPPNEQIVYQDGVWRKGDYILPTNERNQVYFSFAQPPGHFTTVSYIDVLNMDDAGMKEFFQNAVVLIGPYSVALGDQYLTPTSSSTKMFGVEIHANMIQAFQDGRFFHVFEGKNEWKGLLLLFVLSLSEYWLLQRMRALSAFFVFAAFVGLYVFAVAQVNYSLNIILPFIYPILAITSTYIWSVVSKYIVEWKERKRVTALFGRYVSESVAKEILQSREAQSIGGTRKNVTLMFVDIRGFTPLSEKVEPEEIIQVLNEYLDLCTRAVFKHSGTLDKFIGDGVMSIFGAPNNLPNHPELAVRAALEMHKGSAELASKLTKKYGYAVSFGIGINSGDAVIGNIGSQSRLDYTAIGDTVNMAARLESNAKPGQILISQATYEQVKECFEIMPLGDIKVKGKEHPVPVYQVLSEKAAVG